MHKIDSQGAVADMPAIADEGTTEPGWWINGDPLTATPPALMDQDYFNAFQLEWVNLLAAAGLTPSRTSQTQFLTSIQTLICFAPCTVAALPAAVMGLEGRKGFVTDSSVVAAGNFGNAVAGSGANKVPVYCDGAAWRIG